MTDQGSPEQKQFGAICTIGKPIARGVLRGVYDKKDVIVKRVDIFDSCDVSELEYLRSFSHENVVHYLHNFSDAHFQYIVLEKCDCTLAEFITYLTAENKTELRHHNVLHSHKKTELHHLDVLWQITKGMIYLHEEKDLIHRDLKPSNVLMVFRDQRWIVKITDFGISKTLPAGRTRVTQSVAKGTEGYMAPEQIKGFKVSKYADIYSLGLVFHYVLSEGKHPFGENNWEAERKMRIETAKPDLTSVKDEYKHDSKPLLVAMIAYKEEDRVCIKYVQAHYLFWSSKKKLTFYEDVSEFIRSPRKRLDEMQPILDFKQEKIAKDWRQLIRDASSIIGAMFDAKRTGNKRQGDGICDLLHNIRNMKHQYGEMEPECQEAIGSMPDGYYQFFKNLFPKLLNHVYDSMERFKEDERFVDYYAYKEQEHLRQNLASGNAMQSKRLSSSSSWENISSDTSGSTPEDMDAQEIPSRSGTAVSTSKALFRTGLTRVIEDMGVADNASESQLVLRNYQWELAEQALRGENSLIVAPTGSGKTAVLTEVIDQHLKKRKGNGRVMFMAPKVVLANQQHQYLQRHLDKYAIGYLIGPQLTKSAPVGQKILDNQVTVVTPQLLINELERDQEATDLSFNDLSMLIFDECHSTMKNHPYRQLMDMVLDFEIANPGKTIQVIGVTASPGVGKGIDKLAVRKNLIELLGNLNVTSAPSMVEKNLRELAEHHSKIKECFVKVKPETEFASEVEAVIGELESTVFMLLERNHATLRTAPRGKDTQAYVNWIIDLKHTARSLVQDGESSRLLLSYSHNLRLYHCLLRMKDLVPNAMEFAMKMAGDEDGVFSTKGPERIELEKKYERLQQKEHTIQMPMLQKLLSILQEEFVRNPEARCMVFVEWKLTAKYLSDHLSKEMKGIKSVYMTGIQSSRGAKGMPQEEQRAIAEAFREGEYKILVATSVGEEGLDFGKCSLVIMYNYVTGEIGRVQRHGRGRTTHSRALLLAIAHGDHKRREDDNKSRAEATRKAIEDIKTFNATALQDEIRSAQEERRNERKKKALIENNQDYEPPSKYQILCGNCRNFLTTGDKLRNLEQTHTVVCDKEFFSRTKKLNVQKQKWSNVKGSTDYLCKGKNCGKKVAFGMDRGDKQYPLLSMLKVLVKRDNGIPRGPMKRKYLPFQIVTSVEDDDDESMFARDGKSSPDESTETSLNDDDCLEILEMENESDCDDLSL